jgi:hypothetical protein
MTQGSWDALGACISQGRAPSSVEIELVASQIWRESLISPNDTTWQAIVVGSDVHCHALNLANLALRGSDRLAAIAPATAKAA